MLYEKTKERVSEEIFKNPPSEYRGAPFWAWNGKLDKDEVVWQTGVFKEMGLGGYHIHVRTGLEDEYLGEKFNECIRACVESSQEKNMLAWLYDEDRWPSGFAGGIVTKNKAFRQRYLLFTRFPSKRLPKFDEKGRLIEGDKLLARYSVHTFWGKLLSYRRLQEGEKAPCTWYAYLRISDAESWYNDNTYVDTLNEEALDEFAAVTYGNYKKVIPEALGSICPAIFTDEPQFRNIKKGICGYEYPWTDDFDKTFEACYGSNILDGLPELFWNKGEFSLVRYRYFDHLSERFVHAFSDNLGEKAEEVGLHLTGHMMQEATLESQTRSVGETMRHYRGFGIPGIDILCSRYEFATAKQCQSVVHQLGKEGMLSELYGVSRWNYDFRMYKIHGDWQAALGVTVRVPHLSMLSMKGEAKRDYPASMFYQSPWYKKFNVVEDHFARVNTALSGGKTLAEIGVIHPIESYWGQYSFSLRGAQQRNRTEKSFSDITEWLLRNALDFDYIDESLLPDLCQEGGNPLQVGRMQYKTVVVPDCITLRKTTLERLEKFAERGGKLIFVGRIPSFADAVPTPRPQILAEKSIVVPTEKAALLSVLEGSRSVAVVDKETGKEVETVLTTLHEKGDDRWLFVSQAHRENFPDNHTVVRQELFVKVKGEFVPTLWNTLDGTISEVPFTQKDGWTIIDGHLYNHDSLLYRLVKGKGEKERETERKETEKVILEGRVPYTIDEPNVLVLDRAKYAVGYKAPYSTKKLDILCADNICRKKKGFRMHGGSICQPWAAEKKETRDVLRLCFDFYSEIEYKAPELAIEDADKVRIFMNGVEVEKVITGWYVDKAIEKVALPDVKKGKNVLEVILPFGENTDTEWCYLLGSFGVKVCGTKEIITALPETIAFGDITKQGFPFYGGKLTYHTSFEGNGKEVLLSVPVFEAPVLEVESSGVKKDIAYAPYSVKMPSEKGKTTLDVTAYISRQNAFGCLHTRSMKRKDCCVGPSLYRRLNVGERSMFYQIVPCGILTPPSIFLDK